MTPSEKAKKAYQLGFSPKNEDLNQIKKPTKVIWAIQTDDNPLAGTIIIEDDKMPEELLINGTIYRKEKIKYGR